MGTPQTELAGAVLARLHPVHEENGTSVGDGICADEYVAQRHPSCLIFACCTVIYTSYCREMIRKRVALENLDRLGYASSTLHWSNSKESSLDSGILVCPSLVHPLAC